MVVEENENHQVRIQFKWQISIHNFHRLHLFHSVPDIDDEQNESLIDNHENWEMRWIIDDDDDDKNTHKTFVISEKKQWKNIIYLEFALNLILVY